MLYHDERTRMMAKHAAAKAGTDSAGEERILGVRHIAVLCTLTPTTKLEYNPYEHVPLVRLCRDMKSKKRMTAILCTKHRAGLAPVLCVPLLTPHLKSGSSYAAATIAGDTAARGSESEIKNRGIECCSFCTRQRRRRNNLSGAEWGCRAAAACIASLGTKAETKSERHCANAAAAGGRAAWYLTASRGLTSAFHRPWQFVLHWVRIRACVT